MPDKAIHRGKPSALGRRHVRTSGRNTSVTLEDAFWDALRDIAVTKGTTRPCLIDEINQKRSYANLSSAIRLFVLAYYRALRR